MSAQPDLQVVDGAQELTVDELAAAAGIPVRRIRFYAGKKLLPPPRLEGRTGLYSGAHLARLRLIAELQDSGYTLSAIEEFLRALPDDADAETVELFGTLLAPTGAGGTALEMSREELEQRLGTRLGDDQLAALRAANLLLDVEEDADVPDDVVRLTPEQLEFTLRMAAVDAPLDALVEAGEVVNAHARRLAEDLQDVFERRILAQYQDPSAEEREQLRALSRALRPLTIQAIVVAYQQALHDVVRAGRVDEA